jgi:hypothetical protein
MKLSRTDVGALAAVAVGGAIGLALLGPRMWGGGPTVTMDITTESMTTADGEATVIIKKRIRRGDGTQEIEVTVDASETGEFHIEEISGDGEHFEWIGAEGAEGSSEHVQVRTRVMRIGGDKGSTGEGENIIMFRTSDGPEPLIYIDGELAERSAMEALGPDGIDRVDVLKGEAAVEKYGAEAAAGVIQIFTKDGAGSK